MALQALHQDFRLSALRPCTKSLSKGVLLVQAEILNQKSAANQKSNTKRRRAA